MRLFRILRSISLVITLFIVYRISVCNDCVQLDNGEDIKKYLVERTKQSTVPNVFVNGVHVGGYDNTSKAQKEGRLAKLLENKPTESTTPAASADSSSFGTIVKPKPGETTEGFVNEFIRANKVAIFSKSTCPFCAKVKELFKSLNQPFTYVELDQIGKYQPAEVDSH